MKRAAYLFLDPRVERERFGMQIGELSPFEVGIPLLDLSSEVIREI